MQAKITRNAAKVMRKLLEEQGGEGQKLRVYVTHKHGDHAHYGIRLDTPSDNDEIVPTDKDIELVLEKGEPLLDGVKVDYLYFPEEHFSITNPAKGNVGDH